MKKVDSSNTWNGPKKKTKLRCMNIQSGYSIWKTKMSALFRLLVLSIVFTISRGNDCSAWCQDFLKSESLDIARDESCTRQLSGPLLEACRTGFKTQASISCMQACTSPNRGCVMDSGVRYRTCGVYM